MKILIVEDEQEMLQNLTSSLTKEQFIIETANDFYSATEKLGIYEYDCVLLDINLPNGSGLEILEALKSEGKEVNVIIISAKDSLDDKLAGLDLGADDYLTKPFHMAELNARLRAVLRRKKLNGKPTIDIANCSMDIQERCLTVDGACIALNRKEYEVLNYFFINKNRLVTKSAIAEHVWGDNIDQADNFDFIYYQIKNIRKKLAQFNAQIEIEAIYGVGYKLIEK